MEICMWLFSTCNLTMEHCNHVFDGEIQVHGLFVGIYMFCIWFNTCTQTFKDMQRVNHVLKSNMWQNKTRCTGTFHSTHFCGLVQWGSQEIMPSNTEHYWTWKLTPFDWFREHGRFQCTSQDMAELQIKVLPDEIRDCTSLSKGQPSMGLEVYC